MEVVKAPDSRVKCFFDPDLMGALPDLFVPGHLR